MKKITLITILVFLSLLGTHLKAQSNDENAMREAELKYCSETIDGSLLRNNPGSFGGAIKLTSSYLAKYVDSNITKLRIGIGECGGVSDTKLWIAKSLTGERIYEQPFDAVVGWNDITLATPFPIAAEDICIGYDITVTMGNPLATSHTPQDDNGGNVYIGRDQTWTKLSTYRSAGNLCIIGIVEGEFDDFVDMRLLNVSLYEYSKINKDISLSGSLRNFSNIPIKSYDVTYKINNEEPVKLSFDNHILSISEVANFEFPLFQIGQVDIYGIKVDISNINGGEEDVDITNNSITRQIDIWDGYDKTILLELFTTESCPSCPKGTTYLKGVLAGKSNIVWMSHHSGYGTDSFTTQADLDMLNLYGERKFAPAVMLDRNGNNDGKDYQSPTQSVEYVTEERLTEELSRPAYMSVNIEGTFDPTNREVVIKVSGDVLRLQNDKLRLSVYIVEDSIKKKGQNGYNGIYTHNNVCRMALAGSWGEDIGFTPGTPYEQIFKGILDPTWVTENMRVIAFVNNYNPDNYRLDCNVYQTEQAFLSTFPAPPVSVNDLQDFSIRVYPNPTSNIVNIDGDYDTLSVIDMTGQTVKTFNALPTIHINDLNNGIYILKLLKGNNFSLVKLIKR